MAVPRGAVVLALSMLLPGASALAQGNYEARYGEPVDVALDDLLQNPGQYEGRAVRTSGRLDLSNTTAGIGGARYAMRDGFGNTVRLAPVSEEFETLVVSSDTRSEYRNLDVEEFEIFF